jgi:hypothetical protein
VLIKYQILLRIRNILFLNNHGLQKIAKMQDETLEKQEDCLNDLVETFLKKICTKKKKIYKHKLKTAQNCHRTEMKRKLKYLKSYNPKEYWKILNSGCTNKRCDIELSDLYNFYKECCNKEVDGERNHVLSEEELKILSYLELNESINEPITHDEFIKCLNNLKNNKASGQDKIINEFSFSKYYVKSLCDFV